MANAVHLTVTGNTLQDVAALYYVTTRPGGGKDVGTEARVIAAIRSATSPGTTDLSSVDDDEAIPDGSTLLIPTLRALPRQILDDDVPSALKAAVLAAGYSDARSIVSAGAETIEQVIPTSMSYGTLDIERLVGINALFCLDGMDRYSAVHLYDDENITSYEVMAGQAPLTLDGFLDAFITAGRPSALDEQQHAERWPIEAGIYVRNRVSEVTKARRRILQAPLEAAPVHASAAKFRGKAIDPDLADDEAKSAHFLDRLLTFQAHVVEANTHCLAGRHQKAIASYHAARSTWHRLMEEAGVRSKVDDTIGVNLDHSLALVKVVLESLPPNEDAVLGVSPVALRARASSARFGLRAFRYDELATSGTDRQDELRGALASVRIHALPRGIRDAAARAALGKDRSELSAVDTSLVSGLLSSPASALARDLEAQDKHVFQRNLWSLTFDKLHTGTGKLGVLSQIGKQVQLRDVKSLVGSLWNTLKADDVLSAAAKTAYPAAFLARTDVTPFTPFVVLPRRWEDTEDTFVPIGADFVDDMRDVVLQGRLTSGSGEDLIFDAQCWSSPSAFAAIAAWVYAVQIPTGLGRSYSKLGNSDLAETHGVWRVDRYSGGSPITSVSGASDTILGKLAESGGLGVVGTWDAGNPADGSRVLENCQVYISKADWNYKQGNEDIARYQYRRALEAIEAGWAATTEVADLRDRLELGLIADRSPQGDLVGPLSTLNIEYVVDSQIVRGLSGISYLTRIDPYEHVTVYNSSRRQTVTPLSHAQVAQKFLDSTRFVQTSSEPATSPRTVTNALEIAVDTALAGSRGIEFGPYRLYFDQDEYSSGDFIAEALHCLAKIAAIDAGLNWWGFPSTYVPPWSFDHLFELARQVADRSLNAEEQKLRLMEAYEAQAASEYLAGQAAELAWEQLSVAEANLSMQSAANAAAAAQADLAVSQATAALEQSQTAATTGMISGVTALLTGDYVKGAVEVTTSLVAAQENHDSLSAVVEDAEALAEAQALLNEVSLSVASAEFDVARMAVNQASEYANYLATEVLNSGAYEYLVALYAEVSAALYDRANLLAWLAQQALAHETRRPFGQVKLNYESADDQIFNLTRSARLTADLEMLRAAYTSGETRRLQEVKWTVALSELAPGALRQLQETGSCTFALLQEVIDRRFPGLFLHSLQDAQLTFIGMLPAEGPRGVLQTSGFYRVRVPNDVNFTSGSEVTADWFVAPLSAASATPGDDNPDWSDYEGFTLKSIRVANASLSLSQFDVRADRAVLRLPQGMLSSVQHIGLDTAWSLHLPRAANNFRYEQIRDIEFTLWFRAAYDQSLADAQAEALARLGRNGELESGIAMVGRADLEDAFAEFRGEAQDAEALDVRLLAMDLERFPAWEDDESRRITQVRLGLWRLDEETPELKLRLCCEHDPVGISFTTVEGLMYSLVGIDASGEPDPPTVHTAFDTWVEGELYDGGTPAVPDKDPGVRWVLKVSPLGGQDAGWLDTDEDGDASATTSGALKGYAGSGSAGSARYDDGDAWTNVRLTAKVRTQGSTVRMVLRDDGTDHFALEISTSQVRLLRVIAGAATEVSARSLAYPTDEYLVVSFAIVGSTLAASIDGIDLWTGQAGGSGPAAGTIGFRVTANGSGPAQFDDVEVVRLTGNGTEAETLLAEPFTSTLPDDWTFVDGTTPWSIDATGHPILDLTELIDLIFRVDYLYEFASNS